MTGTYAPAMQANLPTPWAGVWERVNTTVFMSWVVVVAVMLLMADRRKWSIRHELSVV